jgi:hypothetical protein
LIGQIIDILTALRAQSFVNHVDRMITPGAGEPGDWPSDQPRLPLGSAPAPRQ